MYIEPELKRQAAEDVDREVEVVIVCPGYSEDVRVRLEGAGFRVASAEEGVVTGKLRLGALHALRGIPELESVELDSEQRAF